MALINNNEKTVDLLIRYGADVNQYVKEEDELRPLHLAAIKGFNKVARLLVKNGANVNAIDKKGKTTPLHLVAGVGNSDEFYDIAELLVENGANVNARNADGVTPLGNFLFIIQTIQFSFGGIFYLLKFIIYMLFLDVASDGRSKFL